MSEEAEADPGLSPMQRTFKGRRGSARDWAPTEEQYEKVLNVAKDERDHLILSVLGESGLRSNEFLNIRPTWLDDGFVTIPPMDEGFRAKTIASARRIPLRLMSRRAWDLLVDYVEAYGEMDFCYGTVYLRVKNAGHRAALPQRLKPHALRAYCATKWAGRIQNVFTLMELMGWETPGVAMRYIRMTGKRAEKAVRDWRVQQF